MESLATEIISYISSDNPQKEIKELRQKNKELFIQSFNPRFLKSRKQLRLILMQTLYAETTRQSLARDAGIDFLMRLSGENQIERALSLAGASAGERAYLLIAGKRREIIRALDYLLNNLKEASTLRRIAASSYGDEIKIGRAALVGIDRMKFAKSNAQMN